MLDMLKSLPRTMQAILAVLAVLAIAGWSVVNSKSGTVNDLTAMASTMKSAIMPSGLRANPLAASPKLRIWSFIHCPTGR